MRCEGGAAHTHAQTASLEVRVQAARSCERPFAIEDQGPGRRGVVVLTMLRVSDSQVPSANALVGPQNSEDDERDEPPSPEGMANHHERSDAGGPLSDGLLPYRSVRPRRAARRNFVDVIVMQDTSVTASTYPSSRTADLAGVFDCRRARAATAVPRLTVRFGSAAAADELTTNGEQINVL